VITFGIAAILVVGFRPYKKAFYNVLDVLILALVALLYLIFLMIITDGSLSTGLSLRGLFTLLCVLGMLPLLYFIILVSYHFFVCLIGLNCIQQKWKAL